MNSPTESSHAPEQAAVNTADAKVVNDAAKSISQERDSSKDDYNPSADQNASKRKAHDTSDSDSEVEDVTDQYVKRKRPASPEIIEVEDVSDEESDRKQSSGHDDSSDGESCGKISSDSDIEDVTEFMMAMKKEQLLEDINGAIDLGDSDSDSEDDTTNAKKKMSKKRKSSSRPKMRKPVTVSPIEVSIDSKDIPVCPGQKCTSAEDEEHTSSSNEDAMQDNNDVDHSIKQRIVKLLNTGFHSESNENEAKNAMKLARRLMERYNLDQSVLLRERGDGSLNDFSTTNDDKDGVSTLGGGIVSVSVCNRKKGKALSSLPRWIEFLIAPICANFSVDAFKTLSRSNAYRAGQCTVSFYGIKTNAQLGAYAFKIAVERISLMSTNYTAPQKTLGSNTDTKHARLSYALGIVIGIDRDVNEELRKEEKRRKAKLNKARRAAKTDDKDACNEDSDDEGISADDGDGPEHPIDLTLEQLENENAAQLALIDHQKKIAKDVLKVSISFY
jgi:hypothetical protein